MTALAALVLAVSACGFGPGEEIGDAELLVTRDFGLEPVLELELSGLTESDTVIRLLERNAEIETRYGGGFVHAIEGLAGGNEDGRPHDWLYIVNGVEADRGSADYTVGAGDRIWWDYRDWSVAMSVPAVVGHFPEPFINGYDGSSSGAVIDCQGDLEACDLVAERLDEAGVDVRDGGDEGAVRVVVGEWPEIEGDADAGRLGNGPAVTGVFARFESASGETQLETFAADGTVSEEFGPGAGLVAAVGGPERSPVWLITGTDRAGLHDAASALRPESLARSYAVVTVFGEVRGLPSQ